MLQVVSPSLGQSVIGVWTAAPKFDNVNGQMDLQGGIPGGITASNALVSTVTFRVKSVGSAIVKFLDGSKVLLNDGLGTDALSETEGGIYQLKLPPPAGPALASETNPDQSQWYQNRTVSFSFASDTDVQGYSYVLSDDPATIPDDVNLGTQNSVTYTDLENGIHFFHIKSLRDGVWGGTTHYSVKIDSSPPADFKIDISPSSHTSNKEPVIQFATTDALSGIDHYEMKIIPLSESNPAALFSETVSPYIVSPLSPGDYDVIVRAYDKAHNYREVTQRLVITNGIFSLIDSSGLILGSTAIPWIWVWLILALILSGSLYGGYRAHRWHNDIHVAHKEKKLPETVKEQLEELKKYRAKYGVKALIIIFTLSSLFSAHLVSADTGPIATPVISDISKDISNKDEFYVGGKTDLAGETVVIFLQNLDTGATLNETTDSDKDGDWFYQDSSFLAPGQYRLWVQGKIGEDLSPPGPQSDMTISRTAIQFGSNRLSYETIYLNIIILMMLAILGLSAFSGFHYYQGRKKRKLLMGTIATTEESIRWGFALIRRDIEAELAVVKQASRAGSLSTEEIDKEEQLQRDLSTVQNYIGKELVDIEHLE